MDSNFKMAVFDVDGVVIDSFAGIVQSINETLIQFGGQPIELDWYRCNHFSKHEYFVRSRGVDESVDLEEFDRELYKRFFFHAHLHDEREGLRQVVEFIRERKLLMHLASACDVALTQVKIDRHYGLAKFFSRIHGGEKKSEAFASIMSEHNLSPDDIIFITDMPRDIDEALSVGIDCNIAIVSDFSTREQFTKYDCPVVNDHYELFRLIQEIL